MVVWLNLIINDMVDLFVCVCGVKHTFVAPLFFVWDWTVCLKLIQGFSSAAPKSWIHEMKKKKPSHRAKKKIGSTFHSIGQFFGASVCLNFMRFSSYFKKYLPRKKSHSLDLKLWKVLNPWERRKWQNCTRILWYSFWAIFGVLN